jgi:hypothetical protein
MRVAVTVVSISLAVAPAAASESCMSNAEARQHFGSAALYWHGQNHCWDATPIGPHQLAELQRKIQKETQRRFNQRSRQGAERSAQAQPERKVQRQADQQVLRETQPPVQREPDREQVQQETDHHQIQWGNEPPNWREAMAELRSNNRPVQTVGLRFGDARSFIVEAGLLQSSLHAWIFILAIWVALLSLILHDVSKDEADGGVVVLATNRLGIFVNWLMARPQEMRKTVSRTIRQRREATRPANPKAADGAGQSEPLLQAALPPAAPAPAATPPKKSPIRKLLNGDARVSIPLPELELEIGKAVKTAAPGCEAFVGVVVRPKTPESRLDANWELAGAKYGKADKNIVNEALMAIVAQMQNEFLITER